MKLGFVSIITISASRLNIAFIECTMNEQIFGMLERKVQGRIYGPIRDGNEKLETNSNIPQLRWARNLIRMKDTNIAQKLLW